jgi:hypothetical protein
VVNGAPAGLYDGTVRLLPVLLVLGTTVLAACGQDEPAMPRACVDGGRTAYEQALKAAPATVRVAGVTKISECLRHARSDAELQNLGVLLFSVAEDLSLKARSGSDLDAAVQLGYLTGAARSGAEQSNGVTAELARRLEVAAGGAISAGAQVRAAVERGRKAGGRRG